MDKPVVFWQKNWFNPDVSVVSRNRCADNSCWRGLVKVLMTRKVFRCLKMIRLEFSDMVKNAFAGDAQGASMAYEIAKDYYAGVMAKRRGNRRMISGNRHLVAVAQLQVACMTTTEWECSCRGECLQSNSISRLIRPE